MASSKKLLNIHELDNFVEQLQNECDIRLPCQRHSELYLDSFFDGEVQLDQNKIDTTKDLSEKLKAKVKKELESDTLCCWDICNAGSYYDGTKVGEPDEYDCLFVLILPDIKAIYKGAPPGFCFIQTHDEQGLPRLCSSKEFLECYTPMMRMVVDKKKTWKCKKTYEGCPTVAVTYTGKADVNIDLDLVPALHVSKWPPVAQKLNFLDEDGAKEIKANGHHVVAKAYKHEHPKKEFLWKIAFNHAEKELTKFADYGGDTCRKKVLRIVKRVFDIAKSDLKMKSKTKLRQLLQKAACNARRKYPILGQHQKGKLESIRFCTYDIRTLLWTVCYERSTKDSVWANCNRGDRLKMVLHQVQKLLSGEIVVNNFFLKDKPIISHLNPNEREYFYIIAKVAEKLFFPDKPIKRQMKK